MFINPLTLLTAKLFNLNLHPLEVVSRFNKLDRFNLMIEIRLCNSAQTDRHEKQNAIYHEDEKEY